MLMIDLLGVSTADCAAAEARETPDWTQQVGCTCCPSWASKAAGLTLHGYYDNTSEV
jgi:hypothetical protein